MAVKEKDDKQKLKKHLIITAVLTFLKTGRRLSRQLVGNNYNIIYTYKYGIRAKYSGIMLRKRL